MANQADTASRPLFRHVRPADLDRTPRSSKPRGKGALLGLILLAIPSLGCISAPTPDQWLAAGDAPFRTPEGTFEAFKTAIAGEKADLGYRCLSAGFRSRNSIGQLAFREILDRYPALKYVSRAEVLERNARSATEIEFLCQIEVLFKTTRLRVGFVREDFYDVYRAREPLGSELQPFEKIARQVDSHGGAPGLSLWVPLPTGLSFDEVTEVRAGREWKLDSVEIEGSDALPAP